MLLAAAGRPVAPWAGSSLPNGSSGATVNAQCPPLPSASVKTSQVLSAQARTCQ
jgi:hypothetical protein